MNSLNEPTKRYLREELIYLMQYPLNAGEENSLIMNVRPVQADFHSLRKEGGSNPEG